MSAEDRTDFDRLADQVSRQFGVPRSFLMHPSIYPPGSVAGFREHLQALARANAPVFVRVSVRHKRLRRGDRFVVDFQGPSGPSLIDRCRALLRSAWRDLQKARRSL